MARYENDIKITGHSNLDDDDDISWLITYDKTAGIKRVSEKLCVTEHEAAVQISKVEANLIHLHDGEGQKRLKDACKSRTSHLNKIGRLYRRQQHRTCCGVASLATALDVLQNQTTSHVRFTCRKLLFQTWKCYLI